MFGMAFRFQDGNHHTQKISDSSSPAVHGHSNTSLPTTQWDVLPQCVGWLASTCFWIQCFCLWCSYVRKQLTH